MNTPNESNEAETLEGDDEMPEGVPSGSLRDTDPDEPVTDGSSGAEGTQGIEGKDGTGESSPPPPSPEDLREECGDLPSTPDILSVVDATLRETGFAGPTWPVQLVTLAVYSRHLSKPVSVVLRGESASGKSHIIKRALEFASPEAHYAFTAMSAKALYYENAELSHRMLVAYEGQGLANDTLAYAIRSLLSEGRLEYKYVDFESRGNVSVTKEGPTGLITSTAGRLDYELGTRVITIPTDDSPDITSAIMLAEAEQAAGNIQTTNTELFGALDRWIEATRRTVVIPFARKISEHTDSRAVRMRRDFSSVLGLIQAHALLHKENRTVNEQGHILAGLDDYAAVHSLVSDLVSYASGESVPPEVRETVDAVFKMRKPPRRGGATVADVAKELGIHRTSAQRRLNRAVFMGYLSRTESRPGKAAVYEWEPGMREDASVLPDPDVLRGDS